MTPIKLLEDITSRLNLIEQNMAKNDPKSASYQMDFGSKIAYEYVKGHIEDMIAMGENK